MAVLHIGDKHIDPNPLLQHACVMLSIVLNTRGGMLHKETGKLPQNPNSLIEMWRQRRSNA